MPLTHSWALATSFSWFMSFRMPRFRYRNAHIWQASAKHAQLEKTKNPTGKLFSSSWEPEIGKIWIRDLLYHLIRSISCWRGGTEHKWLELVVYTPPQLLASTWYTSSTSFRWGVSVCRPSNSFLGTPCRKSRSLSSLTGTTAAHQHRRRNIGCRTAKKDEVVIVLIHHLAEQLNMIAIQFTTHGYFVNHC